MTRETVTYVQKACAYLTRPTGELLVFEGPNHEGLQIPKGTVEPDETPRVAVYREVAEETGLGAFGAVSQIASDVWRRRESRWYVRYFFHAVVHDSPDRWTHTVTDGGAEHGSAFTFSWVDPATTDGFALDLDAYLDVLAPLASR
jgi:ADP-ribose pyrophosphatase YjhB (NUDIX family)